jgi:hypothetical protein
MPERILREIRRYRDQYAARFAFDVRAMGRDLRKREAASGRKLATRGVHRVKP